MLLCRGPVQRALCFPGEPPTARLVIHRQTPYVRLDVRKRCLSRRGQALAHFFILQPLATYNGRTPYYHRAPRGGCCWVGGRHSIVHRISGSEPLRLRTCRLRDRSRLSGVPLSSTRLRQHGLTPTSREDQYGKPALERID